MINIIIYANAIGLNQLIFVLAQSIGTAAAIQQEMEEVKAYRKQIAYQNWRRVRAKILAVVRFRGTLRRINDGQRIDLSSISGTAATSLKRMPTLEPLRETLNGAHNTAKSRLIRWTKKIQGKHAVKSILDTETTCLRYSNNNCFISFRR